MAEADPTLHLFSEPSSSQIAALAQKWVALPFRGQRSPESEAHLGLREPSACPSAVWGLRTCHSPPPHRTFSRVDP